MHVLFLIAIIVAGCTGCTDHESEATAEQMLPIDDEGGEEPCGYDEGCGSPGQPDPQLPVAQCYSPLTWIPECMALYGIPYAGVPGSECLSPTTWWDGCWNLRPTSCYRTSEPQGNGMSYVTSCCVDLFGFVTCRSFYDVGWPLPPPPPP